MAYAKGARLGGATIREHTPVTRILAERGRVTGVMTADGPVRARTVVICGGMWARDWRRRRECLCRCMPRALLRRHRADRRVPAALPVLRVPDECAYYKEDAGKILLGVFEPMAKPWGMNGIPEEFCFDELPDDLEHMAPILETATRRMPMLGRLGIRTFFNGPESFTPRRPLSAGRDTGGGWFLRRLGFNSVGIQSAAGAGKALAEWIVGGAPPFDLWDVDVRRTFPWQSTRAFIVPRVSETLGLLYADHFPFRQFATSRGVRHSPLHEQLAARGAYFGEVAGWERPHWFLPESDVARGQAPEPHDTWSRPRWHAHVAAEHIAVRTGVGLFDMSPFGKIHVEGADAEAVLQRVCANHIAVAPGRIVYTQWLNERGGIEADLTVTRLAEATFLVVTGAATIRRDLSWLKRQIPNEARCVAVDVSSGEACLALMGPNSRSLLQAVTPDDLSNAAFPFATQRTIEIGMAHVRAHRITYVGELGFELYVPTEFARHVLDVLLEAGTSHGIRPAGMLAMDTLRLEKGYRHFGHDICDEDHVLEAGLGFAVKTEKRRGRFGDFIGREAVLRKRDAGLARRLLQFKLDVPEPLLFHNEPVLRDGRIAGHLSSGGYGHTLGTAVGLGYVPCRGDATAEELLSSRYEIEVAGCRLTATATLKPFYDPTGARARA